MLQYLLLGIAIVLVGIAIYYLLRYVVKRLVIELFLMVIHSFVKGIKKKMPPVHQPVSGLNRATRRAV